MLYSLEQGPGEAKIIKQCVKENLPLPNRIQNAPTIIMGLEFFFQAFRDLNTCRIQGMSEGPIPWTAIEHYCQLKGIVGQQKEDLFYHIGEMDSAYLSFSANKATNG